MAETALNDINRFSWQRVRQFGGLFRQSLRNQIIIYTLIEALLVIVTSVFPREEIILGACCIIWIMSLAVPYVFTLRDDTLLRLAPVKASERLSFYLLWIMIIFPLLMTAIQWLLMYIGWLYEPHGLLEFVLKSFTEASHLLSWPTAGLLYCVSFVTGYSMYFLVTDAAVTCRRHPVLWGVIRTAIVLISLSFIGAMCGVIYALLGLPLEAGGMENMLIWIEVTSGVLSLPVGILALRHLYKYLK